MTGKEIRSWALEQWKENVWFILLASLLSGLPNLLVTFITDGEIVRYPLLVRILEYGEKVLFLGFILTVLTLIREKRKDLGCLIAPFQNYKALLLALILLLWDIGKGYMEAVTEGSGLMDLLAAILSLVVGVVFFTLEYDLFLFPDRSLVDLFRDSAAVGSANFGEIFIFHLVLVLIPVGVSFAGALMMGMMPGLSMGIGVLLIAFTIAYQPFAVLAEARMAMEVSGVGDRLW